MKFKILILCLLMFGCASKNVVSPTIIEKPQIIYQAGCDKNIAKDHLPGIIESTKNLCENEMVDTITLHFCVFTKEGAFAAQVSYSCEIP